jgi:fructose-1,6-bisphosphatase/inositol monophosphatase family enzyme
VFKTGYLFQGAFLNGKRLRVSSAADVNHAMIVNNIGKGRDGPFISKTLNRLDALLANNVQVQLSCYACSAFFRLSPAI